MGPEGARRKKHEEKFIGRFGNEQSHADCL